MNKLAYIAERFADGQTQAVIGRPVADPNTKTEASLRQFVYERRSLGIIRRMACIDICNGGAKGDLMSRQSQGFTQPQPISKAWAIDSAKSFLFETLC